MLFTGLSDFETWSVLNYVPRVLSCPTCLTCLRALRVHVLYVPAYLRDFTSYVPSFFYLPSVPSFFYVPYLSSFFKCLTCLSFFTCLTCPHIFKGLTCVHFLHALRNFTFLSVSNFRRTLCAFNFFIKCGTTHNQPQQATISKNDVE